jgi:hypothetical protein
MNFEEDPSSSHYAKLNVNQNWKFVMRLYNNKYNPSTLLKLPEKTINHYNNEL